LDLFDCRSPFHADSERRRGLWGHLAASPTERPFEPDERIASRPAPGVPRQLARRDALEWKQLVM
jgi:hypothetical protein